MNLYDFTGISLEQEWIDVLQENGSVRIERIVSSGHTSDWYDQDEHEFVALLSGEAKLLYETGEVAALKAGDTLMIPAHCKHRVVETSKEPICVWLCVFFGGDVPV